MFNDLINEKNWIFNECDKDVQLKVQNEYNLPPFIAKSILSREKENIDGYINPDITSFIDPYLLDGMIEAVEKINEAVKNMKTIIIYGDYDVDGITSTYILVHYIKSIGGCVSYFIPSRLGDGYGLNERALLSLKEKGADLVITVDLGINAIKEAKLCKEIGLDLIITDHHIPPENEKCDCVAVINPKISKNYPFKSLCGAGVAFKLVCALSKMDKKVFDYYIAFAAIGTIADLVELTGENRFIAKYGLSKIKDTLNKGLLGLLECANIDINSISSSSVSFGIAPRLNAAGRLSSADISVELLLSNDEKKAIEVSSFLETENIKRKEEELKIFNEADKIIFENELFNDDVIVVSSKGWHHGVIGIASSKTTEKYYKPSIIISVDEFGEGKASGRSILGFNLFDAIKNSSDYVEKYGGHALAAGLTIKEENIENFRKSINEYAKDILTDEILTPSITIDDTITLSDVNLENIEKLKILEPYGTKNPNAYFCIKNLKIVAKKENFDKPHSFLTVTDCVSTFTMPAFNMKDKANLFEIGDFIDVCGIINKNDYNLKSYAQFIIRDLRPSRKIFFTRSDLKPLYALIKNEKVENVSIYDIAKKLNLGSAKLYRMLNTLSQLDIIKFEISCEDRLTISKSKEFEGKTDLNMSLDFNTYSYKEEI